MIDVQTLLFASGTARAGFILIFLIASFKSEARVAFRFWTASILGSAMGVFLIYSDPNYPYFTAVRGMAIYAVIGLSLSCIWAGGCAFFGRELSRTRFSIMGLTPGVVYGAAYSFGIAPNVVVLLTITTLVCSTAVVAHTFLTRKHRHYLPSQLLVGIALTAYSFALAASVILIAVKLMAPGAVSGPGMSDIGLSLFIDQLMSVLTYVGLVAMSLEAAQLRIKTLATMDPLTGLANRRGVETKTLALIAACHRAKQPMVVLIADLDHFKSINDRYGHNSGDAVLKAFAARLSLHCRREQDVAGRWGGEEFLAVLSNMTLEEAIRFAEELCLRVSEEPFDIGDSKITVTVSIGVAAIDDHAAPLEHAVKNADEALYEAKRNGRNRVCSAVPMALPEQEAQPHISGQQRRAVFSGMIGARLRSKKRKWKIARPKIEPLLSQTTVVTSSEDADRHTLR